MKKIIPLCRTLLLTLLLVVDDAFGVEEMHLLTGEYDGLTYRVLTSADSVLPYESLGILASVKNTSPQMRRVKGGWSEDSIVVAFKIKNDGVVTWREVVSRMRGEPLFGIERSFAPGDFVKWKEIVNFDSPGEYEVKVSVGYRFEAIVKITVREPKGRDKEALDFLRAHNLGYFVNASLQPQFGEYAEKDISAIGKFILDYPDSYYSHLAQIGLGVMWTKQAQFSQNSPGIEQRKMQIVLDKAEAALQLVVEKGPLSLQGEAYHYLSHIAQEKGQYQKAKELAAKLLAVKPTPYYMLLAKETAALVEGMDKQSKKTSENPDKVFAQTIKELEAQWYDVKGFLKGNSEESKKLDELTFELADRTGAEKPAERISKAEFDRQSAELLKTFVKKYSKPLTPEEWKRRYAEYEREEKQGKNGK